MVLRDKAAGLEFPCQVESLCVPGYEEVFAVGEG